MVPLLTRVTVLKNNTHLHIHIKERRRYAPEGYYSYTIGLRPFEQKEISATMFHQRAMDSGRPTVLPIFAGGVDTTIVLAPQDFINNGTITFRLDEEQQVIARGVKARFTDLGRLRGLGFLLGREYPGRQEEDIS